MIHTQPFIIQSIAGQMDGRTDKYTAVFIITDCSGREDKLNLYTKRLETEIQHNFETSWT